MSRLCPRSVQGYAIEDINAALDIVNRNGIIMKQDKISFECGDVDDAGDYTVYATAIINCLSKNTQFDFTVEYVISGDDVYVGGDVAELAESLIERCNRLEPVQAATAHKKCRITAAEGNDDMFSDTVDDLSDTVDDIQDTLDDIDEDDVDIELNNNIAEHFIAECDSCHGVFISAMVNSDQDVTSINGVCPLCDKETEQLLKWVIKER